MHIRRTTVHYAWDQALPPVAAIGPGDIITVETTDAGGGQLSAQSKTQDVPGLDFTRVNPVTGPVRVDGAAPGDALVVTLHDVQVGEWGWTANIPGFGLLSDEFPEPHLWISTIAAGRAELPPGLSIPVKPMIGTIGVAPAEPGEHSIIPPRRWGGNLDIRHIGPGAQVIFPVGVGGALLSLGDAHAAMGDGEVCGTGVETSAIVRLQVDVLPGEAPRTPVLITDPRSHRSGRALATTGIAPDLMTATRDATAALIGEISKRTGLGPADAYLLASVAADLKISEVVDVPNWVVTAHIELDLLSAMS